MDKKLFKLYDRIGNEKISKYIIKEVLNYDNYKPLYDSQE